MSLSGRHPRPGASGYPLASRPIRNVLRWQGIATLVGAGISGVLGGTAAAWSAAAGGAIPLVSTVAYALVLGLGDRTNAGSSVVTMLRAEGAKIAAIICGLWMVLRWYPGVVASALFITFVVSVLLFRVAFLTRGAGGVPPN